MLKAKNEHEEKKTKILGNIFANVAFFPGFSVGEANHLLQIAQNLTYRGMCILALIKRKDQIQGVKLREDSYRGSIGERVSYETVSILQEAYQIYNSGLIACKQKSSEKYEEASLGTQLIGIVNQDASKERSLEEYEALLGCADVAPNRLLLSPMAERYYEVMGLEDIPEEDIKEIAKYLI